MRSEMVGLALVPGVKAPNQEVSVLGYSVLGLAVRVGG